MSGLDREQHRFALALIGPVLLAVELDEPYVFLTDDKIAGPRAAGDEARAPCLCVFKPTRPGLGSFPASHDLFFIISGEGRTAIFHQFQRFRRDMVALASNNLRTRPLSPSQDGKRNSK